MAQPFSVAPGDPDANALRRFLPIHHRLLPWHLPQSRVPSESCAYDAAP